jgi:hypothetical protein
MRVPENPEYFIRVGLPNVIDALEIQKHLGKLIKPRKQSLGLRTGYELLAWIFPELDRNMCSSKS